jgi:diketogulonate reductase-like aldo/keto reductase
MIQKTKKLNDSVEIPLIGLGTWQVNGAECTQMVSEAFELGYRHFDTAQVYENHKAVGEALKGIPKDQYFLSTKLAWDFLEPDLVEKQCDICLKELGIDQIDLFLIHWPNRQKPMLKVMEKCMS